MGMWKRMCKGKEMGTMGGRHRDVDTETWHGAWGNGHRDVGTELGDVAQGEDRAQ